MDPNPIKMGSGTICGDPTAVFFTGNDFCDSRKREVGINLINERN
jgi:hypothetical protein